MLVTSRKACEPKKNPHECLIVQTSDGPVVIRVCRVTVTGARLGVEAPKQCSIIRGELGTEEQLAGTGITPLPPEKREAAAEADSKPVEETTAAVVAEKKPPIEVKKKRKAA